MALSEPAFTFTIPSINDDTPLDCRIYHPPVLAGTSTTGTSSWIKKGAVVAHPYAPLGGSYDDHVVAMMADELLKVGFVVGTFNFRGARSSKGRTSWTGRPELDDYISFTGFLVHYLNLLHPPATPRSKEEHKEKALLILAGYSYGSLIAKHLPPTSQILEHFSLTTAGSAAAEILLRAHTLSAQSNRDLEDSGQSKTHSSHEHSLTVKMGGEETSPEIRRSSREIRRSSERARSLDLQHSIRSISLRRRRRDDNSLSIIESRDERPESASPAVEANTYPAVSTAYLLISTVPAPLSTLMIPAVEHKIWNRHKDYHADNIVQRPTLALFGDQDGFVAVRKYRHWAARLKAELGSRFEYQEVTGAGHFWHEEGAELHLRNAIQKWAQGL